VVPGHASVLASFDPDLLAERALRSILSAVADETAAAAAPAAGTAHDIRVAYGGVNGPDLADVAARTGLSERDVVRLHAGVLYRVLVLGFVPGFPYLGILPEALDLPRRETPRLRVAAGSVAIAGRQTGIYPFATPGGWHLIGRTEAAIWDPRRDPPALLAPGDRVRFVAD
jgi:KipI family sensor histidine kinase inhibitor